MIIKSFLGDVCYKARKELLLKKKSLCAQRCYFQSRLVLLFFLSQPNKTMQRVSIMQSQKHAIVYKGEQFMELLVKEREKNIAKSFANDDNRLFEFVV